MNSAPYDVLEEHQRIRGLVHRIESILEGRRQAGGDWVGSLRPLLQDLSMEAGPHFDGEEAELFRDVRERFPSQVPTIDNLVQQHRQLLSELVELSGRCQEMDDTDSGRCEKFADRLGESLRSLRRHEEEEDGLMLLAYWQDLGESLD